MRLSDFLRGIGRPVVYYPSLNPITGGVTATIFLLTFVQWHGTQHDPQGWIYKTQGEIERETGLSRYEQETARKQLRTRDLLREKRRGVPARLHYRVQLDRLNAAWERNATIKNGGNPQTGMGGTDEQVWGEAADYLRVHDPGETNRENDVEHSNLRTVSPDNASVEQDAPPQSPLAYDRDRETIGNFIADVAREFNDQALLPTSISRAANLYHAADLPLDAFLDLLLVARTITRGRTAVIRATDEAAACGRKRKMPYFFSVLADRLRVAAPPDQHRASPRRVCGA